MLMQDMAEDFRELGFVFEWQRLDSQDFLVRQRRNRVWGTADICRSQNEQEYSKNMQQTIQSLKSTSHFPFEEVFDVSLPGSSTASKTELYKHRISESVRLTKEHGKDTQNLFIDCSTSRSRKPEFACEVTPCIRPTHQIWSNRLNRHVTVDELFRCQGIFRNDFPNPAAYDSLLERSDAQDLCGNAFTSTVMQAKLVASLVHSQCWRFLAECPLDKNTQPIKGIDDISTESAGLDGAPTSRESLQDLVPHTDLQEDIDGTSMNKRRRIRGKQDYRLCPGYSTMSWSRHPSHPKSAVKRRRGRPRKDSPTPRKVARKASGQPDSEPDGDQGGVYNAPVKREGKKSTMSIWTKVQLLKDPCGLIGQRCRENWEKARRLHRCGVEGG